MGFGVSQIDAGSRIELGGYTEAGDAQQQVREREQFELGDVRSLDEVIRELLADGYIPASAPPVTGWDARASSSWNSPSPASSAVLHAQRADDPAGIPGRLRLARHARGGRALIRQELAAAAGQRRNARADRRLERIATTDERDLYY